MNASLDDLLEAVMQMDREFDQATHEGGLDAWVSYFAEDGVMAPPQGPTINGRDAIRQAMAQSFALPGFSLRWQPSDARVSVDGSMGVTYGEYQRQFRNKAGDLVTATGRYTTIWYKQADGSWRITLDIAN